MNVKDIMTSHPVTCAPTDHLGTAVWRMWRADCGFLPVTSGDQVVGVITDRDAAVSLMLRGRKPEEILVGEVMQGYDGLVACDASDPVRLAMDLMRQHRAPPSARARGGRSGRSRLPQRSRAGGRRRRQQRTADAPRRRD